MTEPFFNPIEFILQPTEPSFLLIEIKDLNSAFLQPLLDSSEKEGFRMVRRLWNEWFAGKQRFSQPGEKLLGILQEDVLVALCGLTRDEYEEDKDIGRIRRLYVLPAFRRRGLARVLVGRLILHSTRFFSCVQVRTHNPEAVRLYESMDFVPVEGQATVTHRWEGKW